MWHQLVLASPAVHLGLAAVALQVLSLGAWWMERRRRNRRDLDAVGMMPWQGIAAMAGIVALLMMAIDGVLWLAP